ncbi:MAG: PKD domain-containing protein [Planctomycetota bacterium]|jgi:PKD repeat protein
MVLERKAKDTLTAVELDCGDTLRFTLLNGETRELTLLGTSAQVLQKWEGGLLYQFAARIAFDSHEMRMLRYVGCQQSFYEPYVISGMRIWFDAVQDVFDLIKETHGRCKPGKRARFAVADASVPLCPQPLEPWCPIARDFIDIKDCFGGDDCWLGAFHGSEAHGGLDINHARGTEILAPMDFDDQFLYKSLAHGDPNNGWCGVRTWPNGDVWRLGVAHILRLLHPEHQPLKAGTHVAEGAAVWVWEHTHSHFTFSVVGEDGQEVVLDPWIIFWQIFEGNRVRKGTINASADLLGPQVTGEAVEFRSTGSHSSVGRGGKLRCFWTFGDGGFSVGPHPTHVYADPGMYPVTLTVDDGMYRDTFTQHITVDGVGVDRPALAVAAPDEFTFRPRPAHVMDTYGIAPFCLPHSLRFTARPTRPMPHPKLVEAQNLGGALEGVAVGQITYERGCDWLQVGPMPGGLSARLAVSVDASDLPPGVYSATVEVECPGALNSPACFHVELDVRDDVPPDVVVLDDSYLGFHATPYFWVGHRFHKGPPKGYNGFSLVNGKRAAPGEFARFTPDLRAGKYEVFFPEIVSSWQDEPVRFAVHVKHKGGTDTVWMQPERSPTLSIWDHMEPNPTKVIGVFDFGEGTDGYVEILAEGSTGQVPADAVVFKRLA